MKTMCINCKHHETIKRRSDGEDDPKYKGSGLYRCLFETQAGVYVTGAWARDCDKYEGKK